MCDDVAGCVRNEQFRCDCVAMWRAWALGPYNGINTNKHFVSKTTKSQCLFKLLTKVTSPLSLFPILCSQSNEYSELGYVNTEKFTIAVNYIIDCLVFNEQLFIVFFDSDAIIMLLGRICVALLRVRHGVGCVIEKITRLKV